MSKQQFFVTNQFPKYIHLLSREAEEGHTVAVHTLTHKWSIYQSVETYMKDFNDMNDIVQKYTGKRNSFVLDSLVVVVLLLVRNMPVESSVL